MKITCPNGHEVESLSSPHSGDLRCPICQELVIVQATLVDDSPIRAVDALVLENDDEVPSITQFYVESTATCEKCGGRLAPRKDLVSETLACPRCQPSAAAFLSDNGGNNEPESRPDWVLRIGALVFVGLLAIIGVFGGIVYISLQSQQQDVAQAPTGNQRLREQRLREQRLREQRLQERRIPPTQSIPPEPTAPPPRHSSPPRLNFPAGGGSEKSTFPTSPRNPFSAASQDEATPKQVPVPQRFRDAVALLIIPNSKSATAFCVDERGYFITHYGVKKSAAKFDELELILSAGQSNERVLKASLVDMPRLDVALLKLVQPVAGLTALPLDDSFEPFKRTTGIAYVFPPRSRTNSSEWDHPKLTARSAPIDAGSVSSDKAARYILKADVSEENGGGPIVNDQGQVVAMVSEVRPEYVHRFAVPVGKLRTYLFRPKLEWRTAPVAYAQRREKIPITVKVTPYLSPLEGLDLKVTLTPTGFPSREFTLQPSDEEGIYETSAALIGFEVPERLKLQVDFEYGSVSGVFPNGKIRLGNNSYMLGDIPLDAFEHNPRFPLLDRIAFPLGDKDKLVAGSKSIGMTIEPFIPPAISYQVTARQGGRETARLKGVAQINGVPNKTPRAYRFLPKLQAHWVNGSLDRDLPPVRIKAYFGSATITGITADVPLNFKDDPFKKPRKLSDFDYIKQQRVISLPSRRELLRYECRLADHEDLPIWRLSRDHLPELASVPIRVGEDEIVVNLNEARNVRIEPLFDQQVDRFFLKSRIADVTVGGGGKTLILHLPDLQQLAVIDLPSRKMAMQIPLSEPDALFAAGAEELIVVYPRKRTIERWDFNWGQKEATAKLPQQLTVGSIAIGSKSTGPLLLHGYDDAEKPHWMLVNLQTLNATELQADFPASKFPTSPPLYAAPNGKVFGSLGFSFSLDSESAVSSRKFPDSRRAVMPHSDVHFCDGRQITTDDHVIMVQHPLTQLFPTSSADHYIGISTFSPRKGTSKKQATITRLRDGKLEHLKTYRAFPILVGAHADQMTLQKRFHYDHESGVLVALPYSNDELMFCPVHKLPPSKAKE